MLLMDKKYPDTELQFVDHTVVFFMLGFEPTILSRNWHGNRLYQTTKTTLRRRIKTELYIKLNYTISGKEWSHDESSAIFKRQELSFMGEYTWRGFDCRRFRVVCKIIVFFFNYPQFVDNSILNSNSFYPSFYTWLHPRVCRLSR